MPANPNSLNTHAQRFKSLEERFWEKVDTSGECWLWIAGTFPSGYGSFWASGKAHPAPRIAWQLTHGPIPDDLFVCHNCPDGDNPLCVNPAHLFLGTHVENMADMTAKGRSLSGDRNPSRTHRDRLRRGDMHPKRLHPEQTARGERNGRAKLTEDDVREIRLRHATTGESFTALGSEFGVHRSVVRDIVQRKKWKHVA